MNNLVAAGNGVRCYDTSMLSAQIGDAIKGMELVEKENEKAKEQKEKISLNAEFREEFKDKTRLLDLKA